MLYQSHCDGLRLVSNMNEGTLLQNAFLNIMSAKKYSFLQGLDIKVKALAEANGVKFKK